MKPAGTAIAIRGLRICHGGAEPALDGLDLDLPAGTFCALMGTSGSGKSSLLAALGGHLAPRAGTIALDGVPLVPRTLPRLRPNIGQVYQDHRLVLQASALDNIMAGAAALLPSWRIVLRHYPAALAERASELLDALGLEPSLLARRADALSGGQAQRIGIARALIASPRLLLADEPLASLDPATAQLVMNLLRQYSDRTGATVICALHQPALAARFADRIIGLDRGLIASDRRPSLEAAA